ncbi:hypothetical protein C2S53_003687 [Perilla frutescens var. hirtella]|uniref:Uncharacterized protein n=1 Tax=Perilla frutescens var. hirtella TaxID=608512 RepID=A0AAD4INU4_PERFH|nr:hypothetical protein C2S53_003687 [Perilla frutescens var. hirtella]
MSMWIFSPFEAVCAELAYRKFGLSLSTTSDKQVLAVKRDDRKRGKEVNSSASQPTENCQRLRAPRFAPELDGIHYFETILPY